MSITPKAIQDLLDEPDASKQAACPAWNVLQRLRLVLTGAGNVAIPPPAQKTFDAEGEILEHAFDFEPPMIIILRKIKILYLMTPRRKYS
jgi:hypothetical protein